MSPKLIQAVLLDALNIHHVHVTYDMDYVILGHRLLRKFSSNLEKKYPVNQTRNFKLENVKNQVQIDRGLVY